MFNGIIYNIGKIVFLDKNKNSIKLGIKSSLLLKKKEIGSSISCNGVCLTVTKIQKNIIFFFVSNETIKRSNLKDLKIGYEVNLEKSLVYGQ